MDAACIARSCPGPASAGRSPARCARCRAGRPCGRRLHERQPAQPAEQPGRVVAEHRPQQVLGGVSTCAHSSTACRCCPEGSSPTSWLSSWPTTSWPGSHGWLGGQPGAGPPVGRAGGDRGGQRQGERVAAGEGQQRGPLARRTPRLDSSAAESPAPGPQRDDAQRRGPGRGRPASPGPAGAGRRRPRVQSAGTGAGTAGTARSPGPGTARRCRSAARCPRRAAAAAAVGRERGRRAVRQPPVDLHDGRPAWRASSANWRSRADLPMPPGP